MSSRRGGRLQEDIVDGITAEVSNRLLSTGERIMKDKSLKEILDKAMHNKPIIYALYNKYGLYYVGQSDSGSLKRVWDHTVDRHAGKWNSFSVYRLSHKKYLDDLESILIRIARPKGNNSRGGFASYENLTPAIKQKLIERFKESEISLNKKFNKLSKEFELKKSNLDKEENKMNKWYKKHLDKYVGKDTPKAIERRRALKREKKSEFAAFEKKKKKALSPTSKELEKTELDRSKLRKLVKKARKMR